MNHDEWKELIDRIVAINSSSLKTIETDHDGIVYIGDMLLSAPQALDYQRHGFKADAL